jgi:hypothetical protein
VDIIRTHHATELITFVSTIHNDLLEELGIAINDDDKPSFNVYLLFYVIECIWLNMIGEWVNEGGLHGGRHEMSLPFLKAMPLLISFDPESSLKRNTLRASISLMLTLVDNAEKSKMSLCHKKKNNNILCW